MSHFKMLHMLSICAPSTHQKCSIHVVLHFSSFVQKSLKIDVAFQNATYVVDLCIKSATFMFYNFCTTFGLLWTTFVLLLVYFGLLLAYFWPTFRLLLFAGPGPGHWADAGSDRLDVLVVACAWFARSTLGSQPASPWPKPTCTERSRGKPAHARRNRPAGCTYRLYVQPADG
jgi:hypothetical protein